MSDKVNRLLVLRHELLNIAVKLGPTDKKLLQELYLVLGDVVQSYKQAENDYSTKEYEYKVLVNKYNKLKDW